MRMASSPVWATSTWQLRVPRAISRLSAKSRSSSTTSTLGASTVMATPHFCVIITQPRQSPSDRMLMQFARNLGDMEIVQVAIGEPPEKQQGNDRGGDEIKA